MSLLFEAVLEQHHDNKIYSDLLTDERVAEAVERHVRNVAEAASTPISKARIDASPSNLRTVADLIASKWSHQNR